MISEVRDAEEKVEREAANLDAARRAFEHERRGVLASMRNARAALRTATDGFWQDTHDLAEAMAAFRREKHEFETAKADLEREKAAVEEARQALNLEREALEAERQAAEAEVEEGGAATGEGGRKRKLWRRVAGWLGRR
jgi:chromosome segregation ATPase